MFGGSVCASADLLPPAGEGWQSLAAVRDGNARPLGKPPARGSIGIPSASLPAAAHAPVKNSQRQRLRSRWRLCRLRMRRAPCGQAERAEDRYADPRARGGPLHRSAPNAFLFGPCTARFLFGQDRKENGGVHPRWTSPLREQTPPWPPFGGPSAPYTAERQAAPVQPARHPTARYSLIFLYNTQILLNIIQTVFVFGV